MSSMLPRLKATFILLVLLLCLPLFALTSEDADWERTHVNFEFLSFFLGTEHLAFQNACYDSGENMLGCFELINSIGQNFSPEKRFIAKATLSKYPDIKIKVMRDFPTFVFTEVIDWGSKRSETYSAAKEFKRAYYKDLYNSANDFVAVTPRFNEFLSFAKFMIDRLPPNISKKRVMAVAVGDMLQVRDGHAHFEPTAAVHEEMRNPDKSFFGIGVTLVERRNQIVLGEIKRDSPAQKADLKVGDVITHVDGREIRGMDLDYVAGLIQGDRGTRVLLTIVRKDLTLPVISVKRDKVVLENFTSSVVQHMGVSFGYLKLREFSDEHACNKMRDAIQKFDKSVRGLIFDLRQNPGGDLDQDVCISALFLGAKTIFVTKTVVDGKTVGNGIPIASRHQAKVTSLPLVVLVDEGSASASELFAEAIRAYQRGWIIGLRTFGKATVQQYDTWPLDPTVAIFHTVERFYDPFGFTPQIIGIEPDFEVYDQPEPSADDRAKPSREADEVPSALPPEGNAWVQTRQPRINQILHDCLNAKHRAINLFNNPQGGLDAVLDYRLLTAEEFLACDLATPVLDAKSL